MRADIAPGGTLPDYELPDHTSVPRRLSEIQIATIATDERHTLQEFRASVGAQRPFPPTAVIREIRPGWDLSAPRLREARDAGNFSPFHGWNKWSPARRKEALAS
jgi:hypothetical protein